jgi:hypothetical protein
MVNSGWHYNSVSYAIRSGIYRSGPRVSLFQNFGFEGESEFLDSTIKSCVFITEAPKILNRQPPSGRNLGE